MTRFYENNFIVIGYILNGYYFSKHTITENVSEELFDEILNNSKIHTVDNPEEFSLNKRRINKEIYLI